MHIHCKYSLFWPSYIRVKPTCPRQSSRGFRLLKVNLTNKDWAKKHTVYFGCFYVFFVVVVCLFVCFLSPDHLSHSTAGPHVLHCCWNSCRSLSCCPSQLKMQIQVGFGFHCLIFAWLDSVSKLLLGYLLLIPLLYVWVLSEAPCYFMLCELLNLQYYSFYLILCSLVLTMLALAGKKTWKSDNSPGLLFSPGWSPMGFFQADPSVRSWIPALWYCYFSCSLLPGSSSHTYSR